MQAVKLCTNKVLQFLTEVRLMHFDLHNGRKLVVVVVVYCLVIPSLPLVSVRSVSSLLCCLFV